MEINKTAVVDACLSGLKIVSAEKKELNNAVDFFALMIPKLRNILLKYLCTENRMLLKMLLVSKTWNMLISNTCHFTNQYMFTNNDFCETSQDIKISDFLEYCLLSQRQYDTFKINQSFMIDLLEHVPVNCWKNGELHNLTFKDKEHVVTFLNILSPTIEELYLKTLAVINTENSLNDEHNEPEFEELKILKLCIVPEVILRLFVQHHPKLKILEIGKFMPFTQTILELLHLNPQIEELTVNDEIYNLTLTKDMELINLKLKSLIIKIDLKIEPFDTHMQCYQTVLRTRYFETFLIAQGKTLKHLACHNVIDMPTIIFKIWNHLTELKKLVIENTPSEVNYELPYLLSDIKINPKLEDLTLAINFKKKPEGLIYCKKMFSKAPNIINLYIRQLDRNIVSYIARNQRCVKKLRCLLIEDGIEIYKHLKQANCDVNREIFIKNDNFYS